MSCGPVQVKGFARVPEWDELSRYRFPFYQAVQSDGIELAPRLA